MTIAVFCLGSPRTSVSLQLVVPQVGEGAKSNPSLFDTRNHECRTLRRHGRAQMYRGIMVHETQHHVVVSRAASVWFHSIHALFRSVHLHASTWNMPAVATVLASSANYMICDDHEFVDNLGKCVSFRMVGNAGASCETASSEGSYIFVF